jgi:hypothetical protein
MLGSITHKNNKIGKVIAVSSFKEEIVVIEWEDQSII